MNRTRTIKTTTVHAREPYNRTGWRVEPGRRYALNATGGWWDLIIPCGPAGYPSPLFYFRWLENKRRAPEYDWFELIGFVDSGDPADGQRYFRIGKGLSLWTPDRVGELVCYANDLPFLYWNNFGSVTLELREL